MARRYCWRTGVVLELEDGEHCPECYSDDHPVYEGPTCGNYARIYGRPGRGGLPCVLPIGHEGDCSNGTEAEARLSP